MLNKRFVYFLLFLLFIISTNMDARQYSNVSKSSKGQYVTEYKVKVLASYPHDKGSYTQGLFFYKNQMYESAGQYGESNFRKTSYTTGKILKMLNFESRYFLEGSCAIKDKVYMLTWRERKGFVYDIYSFKQLGEFRIPGEGWGLTTDGKSLIMSDGTSNLYYMNPETFVIDSTLQVKMHDKPMTYLNELEYINGDIWANIYGEDYIVIIDADTGNVKGRIDCKYLLPNVLRTYQTDVLNGIAYNPITKSIYLTGKYWPKLYKVSIYRKR